MTWYSKVTSDISNLPEFLDFYESEMLAAKRDVVIHGNVEKNIAALPGITEFRFNQLQEIEAILRYMELQLKKLRRKHFQKYLEGYARTLTSRDAEKYTDGEEEVCDYEALMNEVALIRNKWMGVLKGLESKNFMLGHIVRLRAAGMEDITL
jgi:hypothetical protein